MPRLWGAVVLLGGYATAFRYPSFSHTGSHALTRTRHAFRSSSVQMGKTSASAPTFAKPRKPELSPDVTKYEAELEEKAARVRNLLGDRLQGELKVQASPPVNYRMRAEFRVWHDGDRSAFALFDPETKKPILLQETDPYPLACKRINVMMEQLHGIMNSEELIRRKLFQVEMLATTDDEALVCMVYKRPLSDAWKERAEQLATELDATVIGRSKGCKHVFGGQGHLVQTYTVNGKRYPQFQTENKFSQSNAVICEAMLHWAQEQTAPEPGQAPDADLLELYCGNGSFTLPLACNFRRVLSTELCKYSVNAAVTCAKEAAVENVAIVKLSDTEAAEAVRGDREFRRLEIAGVDLEALELRTLLVDPPRAGLSPASLELARGFPKVLYVSCNPARLVEDLDGMPEHRIVDAVLFDQFPWTDHAEVAVCLERTPQ